MIITSHYETIKSNQYYYIFNYEQPLCPYCGAVLKSRDSRKRKLILENGDVLFFRLRRLQCPFCHTLHQEIPDFMEKHKHYSKQTIEHAISGKLSACPADNATIFRWKKEYL